MIIIDIDDHKCQFNVQVYPNPAEIMMCIYVAEELILNSVFVKKGCTNHEAFNQML